MLNNEEKIDELTPAILKQCMDDFYKINKHSYMNPEKLVLSPDYLIYAGNLGWVVKKVKNFRTETYNALRFYSAIRITDRQGGPVSPEILFPVFAEIAASHDHADFSVSHSKGDQIVISYFHDFGEEEPTIEKTKFAIQLWLMILPQFRGINRLKKIFFEFLKQPEWVEAATQGALKVYNTSDFWVPFWNEFQLIGNGQISLNHSVQLEVLKDYWDEIQEKLEIPEKPIKIVSTTDDL